MTAARRLNVVVCTLLSESEIKGILREETDDALILSSASVAGTVGDRTVWRPLVGEVVIPKANLDYYQRSLPADVVAQLNAAPEG